MTHHGFFFYNFFENEISLFCACDAKSLYDSNRAYADDVRLRQQLVPLFDRYSVDLYVSGHEHHYERTYALRNNRVVMQNGTVYTGTIVNN